MKYDFILFENFYWATNHYKDLSLIAELFKQGGHSVAIADVFQEAEKCNVPGVPHIPISVKLNSSIKPAKSKYTFWGELKNVFRKYFIDRYLKEVVREIGNMADSFYVGSYHSGVALKWLSAFPKERNVIFWGLRSYRLYEYKIRPFSKVAFNSWRLRRYVDKNQQVRFFVSDELIKQEFIHIGIPENRLVIRPERYIEQLSPAQESGNKESFEILSIGSLRPDKRIEFILDALNYINDKSIHYTIAGRVSDNYKRIILNHITDAINVETLFGFISEDDFIRYIRKSDFLVLADVKQPSLVSNGTMNEALLNGTPIIVPNYLPYSYYINQYGVGLLFNPDNPESLERAIENARKTGRQSFQEKIRAYQKMFLFEEVSNVFNADIDNKFNHRGE